MHPLNQAAYELEALARYHEESGEPFTPYAMRQLATKWRAEAGRMPESPSTEKPHEYCTICGQRDDMHGDGNGVYVGPHEFTAGAGPWGEGVTGQEPVPRVTHQCPVCAQPIRTLRDPVPGTRFFHGYCVGNPAVEIVEEDEAVLRPGNLHAIASEATGKSLGIARAARLAAAGVKPGYRFYHSAGDVAGRECVLQRRGGWGIAKESSILGGPAKGYCALAHPICTCRSLERGGVVEHLHPCDLYFKQQGMEVPIYPAALEVVQDVNLDGWHEWCEAHGRDPDPEAMREWLSELTDTDVTMHEVPKGVPRLTWERDRQRYYAPGHDRPMTYEGPAHEFDAGYSGQSKTCNQLVERDGVGDDCGLPPEPIHHDYTPQEQP